jgi:hypothetical protein
MTWHWQSSRERSETAPVLVPRGDEGILGLLLGRLGGPRLVSVDRGQACPGIGSSYLGSGVWLLACHAELESPDAVDELQEAFLTARDEGAECVVVDLSELRSVSLDAMQLLVAIADIELAEGGRLWLACRDERLRRHQVVALEGEVRQAFERLIARRIERLRLPLL